MCANTQDAIFEDFDGEAVGICLESIIKASSMINSVVVSQQQAGSMSGTNRSQMQANTIDGELFVTRHLLILKEMIRTLDVFQVERAVDLGPITDVLKEILNPSLKDSLIFKSLTLMSKLKSLNHSQQMDFSKRMRYQKEDDNNTSFPAAATSNPRTTWRSIWIASMSRSPRRSTASRSWTSS